MPRIELASATADDFDRIFDHLALHGEASSAPSHIADIVSALEVLGHSPLIGRRAGRGDLRELVIGQRSRGYVALYRHAPELDTVYVLAIRSQREAGYRDA